MNNYMEKLNWYLREYRDSITHQVYAEALGNGCRADIHKAAAQNTAMYLEDFFEGILTELETAKANK